MNFGPFYCCSLVWNGSTLYKAVLFAESFLINLQLQRPQTNTAAMAQTYASTQKSCVEIDSLDKKECINENGNNNCF